MRTIALLLSAAVLASAQDDVEAKKKKLGDMLKEIFALEGKGANRTAEESTRLRTLRDEGDELVRALTGGARDKVDALIADVVAKYAPELKPELEKAAMRARETHAMVMLKNVSQAAELFYMDQGRYWKADVSGLHRTGGAGGYIDRNTALADAKPCLALDAAGEHDGVKLAAVEGKPAARNGYWLAAVPQQQNEKGEAVPMERYAVCAYPSEYGKTGKHTFVVGHDGRIWRKDTGGKALDVMPADPKKDGWE